MSASQRASSSERAPRTSPQITPHTYDPASTVRLPRRLYHGGTLPAQAVRVAAKIIKLGYRSDAGCTMRLDNLAWQLGINPSTADRAVKALTKARILTTHERITAAGSRPAERHIVPPRGRGVPGWVDIEVGALDKIRSGPQFVAYAEALFLARTGQLVSSTAIARALGVRSTQAVQHLAKLEAVHGVVKTLHRAGPGGVNLYLVAASRDGEWINALPPAPPQTDANRSVTVRRRLHQLRSAASLRRLRSQQPSPVLEAYSRSKSDESPVEAGNNNATQAAVAGLESSLVCEAPDGGLYAAPGEGQFEAPNSGNQIAECDGCELERSARPAVSARNATRDRSNDCGHHPALAESGAGAPGRDDSPAKAPDTAPGDSRVGTLTGKAAEFVTATLDAWESRDVEALDRIHSDAEWWALVDGLVARVERREATSSDQVTYVLNGLGWRIRDADSGKVHAIRLAIHRALEREAITPNRLAIRLQTHLRRYDDRGEPIEDLVAWVKGVGLVRPYGCSDPDCEDGLIWDTWQRCPLCDERRRGRALAKLQLAAAHE